MAILLYENQFDCSRNYYRDQTKTGTGTLDKNAPSRSKSGQYIMKFINQTGLIKKLNIQQPIKIGFAVGYDVSYPNIISRNQQTISITNELLQNILKLDIACNNTLQLILPENRIFNINHKMESNKQHVFNITLIPNSNDSTISIVINNKTVFLLIGNQIDNSTKIQDIKFSCTAPTQFSIDDIYITDISEHNLQNCLIYTIQANEIVDEYLVHGFANPNKIICLTQTRFFNENTGRFTNYETPRINLVNKNSFIEFKCKQITIPTNHAIDKLFIKNIQHSFTLASHQKKVVSTTLSDSLTNDILLLSTRTIEQYDTSLIHKDVIPIQNTNNQITNDTINRIKVKLKLEDILTN